MQQLSALPFEIGLATAKGPVRDRNEDASLAAQFILVQADQQPLPVGLFIVADGMGGHGQGEQASSLACRLAADHVIRHIYLPILSDGPGVPINEVLEESTEIGHRAILRQLDGAGTTLTIALVLGDDVHIAHVGDGRAYLGQPGRLRLLTQDHSVAERLLEVGQGRAEDLASERRVLYKALGHGPGIRPDILHEDLEDGSYLLLCCDGLWGILADAEIAALVSGAPTPQAACQGLVAQAIERGGEDNITVVLAARGWPWAARQDRAG
jgi:serine/threonine protein phosphatase PrpC